MTVHEVLNEISNDIQFNEQLYRAGYLSQGQFVSNLNWLLTQREAVITNQSLQWNSQGSPVSMVNASLDTFIAENPAVQSAVGDLGIFPAIIRIFIVIVVIFLIIGIVKR